MRTLSSSRRCTLSKRPFLVSGREWVNSYGVINRICIFLPTEESQYPATLILTADHDDRVSPLHSLKYAATLQEKVADCSHQKNPILLRVYTKAGHGAGKPTSKKIEESTDILTFIAQTLKIHV